MTAGDHDQALLDALQKENDRIFAAYERYARRSAAVSEYWPNFPPNFDSLYPPA